MSILYNHKSWRGNQFWDLETDCYPLHDINITSCFCYSQLRYLLLFCAEIINDCRERLEQEADEEDDNDGDGAAADNQGL